MYSLILTATEYKNFKKNAKKQMIEMEISYEDLSEQTGYSLSAIYNFFSNRNSKFVAYAIAKVLGMEGEEK